MAAASSDQPRPKQKDKQQSSTLSATANHFTFNYKGRPNVVDGQHRSRADCRGWLLTIDSYPDGRDHIQLRRPVVAGPLIIGSDAQSSRRSSDTPSDIVEEPSGVTSPAPSLAGSTDSKNDAKAARAQRAERSDDRADAHVPTPDAHTLQVRRDSSHINNERRAHEKDTISVASDPQRNQHPAGQPRHSPNSVSKSPSGRTQSASEDDDEANDSPLSPSAGSEDPYMSSRQVSPSARMPATRRQLNGPGASNPGRNGTETDGFRQGNIDHGSPKEEWNEEQDDDDDFQRTGSVRQDTWRLAREGEETVTMGLDLSPLTTARRQRRERQMVGDGNDLTEAIAEENVDYNANPRRSSRPKKQPGESDNTSMSATPAPAHKPAATRASLTQDPRRGSLRQASFPGILRPSPTFGPEARQRDRPSTWANTIAESKQKAAQTRGRKPSNVSNSQARGRPDPKREMGKILQDYQRRQGAPMAEVLGNQQDSREVDALTRQQAGTGLQGLGSDARQDHVSDHHGGNGTVGGEAREAKKTGSRGGEGKRTRKTAPPGGRAAPAEGPADQTGGHTEPTRGRTVSAQNVIDISSGESSSSDDEDGEDGDSQSPNTRAQMAFDNEESGGDRQTSGDHGGGQRRKRDEDDEGQGSPSQRVKGTKRKNDTTGRS